MDTATVIFGVMFGLAMLVPVLAMMISEAWLWFENRKHQRAVGLLGLTSRQKPRPRMRVR